MAVAVCIEAPTIFKRRIIDNTTAVPIGTIMKAENDGTVVVSAASADPFGGICWVAHTANEGVTELTVAMNGRWEMTSTAAAIPAGNAVSIAGANTIRLATEADTIVGAVVGKILTEESGTGGQVTVDVGTLV